MIGIEGTDIIQSRHFRAAQDDDGGAEIVDQRLFLAAADDDTVVPGLCSSQADTI